MLRRGTIAKSKNKDANPESIRLNPKRRSNLAPPKSINGNCVKNIAVPLMKFNNGFFWVEFLGHDFVPGFGCEKQ
jgi:hypothetical protein